MDLIQEYNKRYEFFKDITGEAMKVHRKFHKGLLESAYFCTFMGKNESKIWYCTCFSFSSK